jgi:hypothetical protein
LVVALGCSSAERSKWYNLREREKKRKEGRGNEQTAGK